MALYILWLDASVCNSISLKSKSHLHIIWAPGGLLRAPLRFGFFCPAGKAGQKRAKPFASLARAVKRASDLRKAQDKLKPARAPK